MKSLLPKLTLLLSFHFIVIYCKAQPGTLDSSFGVNGVATTHINASDMVFPFTTAIQKDGKIVVTVGTNIARDFSLVRYQTNGNLDSSFGINGQTTAHFDAGSLGSYLTSVVIQPDGKILTGGYLYSSNYYYSSYYFALARFLPDGTLDSSFGLGGKALTYINSYGSGTELHAMTLDNNGKILAGGISGNGSYLVQYLSNGTVDSTFGINGALQYSLGYLIRDIKTQKDGKIVVTSKHWNEDLQMENFGVYRLSANGNFDSTFGNNGQAFTNFPNGAEPYSSAILQDGTIVVGGTAGGFITSPAAAIVKYKSDGSVDSSFGSGGKKVLTIESNVQKILVQSDGKIIAALWNFMTIRLNSNGAFDSTFGVNGIASSNLTSNAYLYSLALQQDEKIIATGFVNSTPTNPNITLIRIKGDLPMINLQRNISISEGNTGTTPAQFKLVLNRPSAYDVQVNYTTINGNAVSGSDYAAASGKAVIKAGKTSKIIAVNIIGDNTREKNEKFALVVGNPVNAQLGPNDTAICTIKNDDPGFAALAADEENSVSKSSAIKLYPNPAKDILRIEGLDASAKTSISVVDMNGNIVLQTKTTNTSCTLNIQRLSAGVYELKMESSGKIKTVKFVKE